MMTNDAIPSILKEFYDRGLVVSPWLMMNSHARFDAELFPLIDRLAADMVENYWTDQEKISFFKDMPIFDRIPRTALYEIIASTSMSITHNRFGDMEIANEQVMEAVERLQTFIAEFGFGSILNIYWIVMSFENMQALHYYAKIPEKIFTMGNWHRPWVDYSLSDELFSGIYFGNYKIDIIDGVRYVLLTEQGQRTYEATVSMLNEGGYLIHRVRQLQIHNFTLYQNYADIANEFWPNMHELRKKLLDWSEIKPGMSVLELGCANGISTFETGLANLVGASGRIIAIDPSMGMIYRANKKKDELGVGWVDFQQAKAEQLPFQADSFDAVIAFNSLQLMDLHTAFKEVMRVLKPTAQFTSLHPSKFSMNDIQIVAKWFQPIIKLAQYRKNESPEDFLKYPSEVLHAFHQVGFVDVEDKVDEIISFFKDPVMVANHEFRGIGWMQEELSMIPWKAREDIINEVIEQGRILCREHSEEERMIRSPMQLMKGRKP